MTYDINPCKSCWQKYKGRDCNINELNDCLVDTATAFSAFPSNNSVRGTSLGQNWQDCIEQRMAGLPDIANRPRSFCNFQLNMAPRWVQTPHYYPQLLEDTQDQEKALTACRERCNGSHACKINCDTDHNAVENFSPNKNGKGQEKCFKKDRNSASIPGLETQGCIKEGYKKKHKHKGPNVEDAAAAHPAAFWILFVIVAILLSFLLIGFGMALFSRRIGQ